VVVKETNILSQSDITNDPDMLTLIKSYLKEKYHKPGNVYLGLVHRLDRVVGGVMVFAKTSKAASRLSNAIRENKFHKDYLAICHGKVEKTDTFIDYLEKNDDFSTIVTDKEHGKLSELSYELIDYNQELDLSLVKVKLKTGRHHQIRVQFSSRNHSLIGDNRYGNDDYKEIGLFAYKLSFPHPITHELISFMYLPKDKPFNIFDLSNVN
jgi:23S rRNA pseudouridine1911/1915/1917 synthase